MYILFASCLDGKLKLNPETNSCQNVHLQRFLGKKLHVAPSDIAGIYLNIDNNNKKGCSSAIPCDGGLPLDC